MWEPVRRAEQLFGDREAVVCGDVRRTHAEMADRVRRVAGMLESISARGDRVALWSLNSDRFLELFFGVPAAGRAIVPHNTRWAEPELIYATEDSGARILICDRDPGGLDRVVDRVIRIDTGEYDELMDAAAPLEPADPVTPDTIAGLFYTGGTTGTSKGVVLTHGNLMANAVHAQLAQPFVLDDRYLTMAPMFHAAGLYEALVLPWVGAANVILPGFDPELALDTIVSESITSLIAVPTMLAALNESQAASPRDVSSLSWISHGASPAALEVLRRAYELFGCELIHLYGATETAPLATVFRHEERFLDTERGKSCGTATPGIAIRIEGPDGVPLPVGEAGEVAIKGPNVMKGYWNKPEQTADVLSDDGWYRSGDIGRLDHDGYLFLVDRAKDMIVTGGENVYCTEVEDVLYEHDAVLEATVFGVPDQRWGEAVHAVVVLRDGHALTDAELIAHCQGKIAGYKLPKSITFQTEPLPKSGPGKVLKRVLRQPFWDGHDTAIN
ncbi:class I adenylate-forming enzyme family protein [Ilumatobacter coccineus]|nr:AMP-binding protein [Ilumatobacter coccineus]